MSVDATQARRPIGRGKRQGCARSVRALAALLFCLAMAGSAVADTLTFHAASSGKPSIDNGEDGGNPFASSLVEILALPRVSLGELPALLQRLNHAKSRGYQSADVPAIPLDEQWTLVPPAAGERRRALVLVVADYNTSKDAPPLPGAKRDAERIAAALRAAGFATELALDLDLAAMRQKLEAFARESATADAAVIYTTGHGVEVDGRIYLLPRDFPIWEGNAALPHRALPLDAVRAAPRARRVNLVFYGGCRDDPLR